MKKFLLSFITISILNSCTNKKPNIELPKTLATQTEETPELFEEKNNISGSIDFKRGYHNNILEELYAEAIDQNIYLENLKQNIDNFRQTKNDSLQDYHSYLRNNNNYWTSAYALIKNINDSVLSSELKQKVQQLESNYKTSIKSLEDEKTRINNTEKLLADKYRVLKLMVTLKMISNYQKNEKPKLETLRHINLEQEKLIQQAEKNTPK